MSTFVTLTTQSQISIPAVFRRQLGFKKGDKLKAEVQGDALVLRPAGDILSLAGTLSHLAKKEKGIQEILKLEEKAMSDAVSNRYLSTLSASERRRIKKHTKDHEEIFG